MLLSARQSRKTYLTIAGISKLGLNKAEIFWPSSKQDLSGKQVLYTDGFATPDKKAVFRAAEAGEIFRERKTMDSIELYFAENCKV